MPCEPVEGPGFKGIVCTGRGKKAVSEEDTILADLRKQMGNPAEP